VTEGGGWWRRVTEGGGGGGLPSSGGNAAEGTLGCCNAAEGVSLAQPRALPVVGLAGHGPVGGRPRAFVVCFALHHCRNEGLAGAPGLAVMQALAKSQPCRKHPTVLTVQCVAFTAQQSVSRSVWLSPHPAVAHSVWLAPHPTVCPTVCSFRRTPQCPTVQCVAFAAPHSAPQYSV